MKLRCAISRSTSAARAFASTRSRPGPIRTLAGAGIGDARAMFAFQQKHSPLRRGVTLEELGGTALYLLSDLSGGRDRRSPFRGLRLQHHLDAASRMR